MMKRIRIAACAVIALATLVPFTASSQERTSNMQATNRKVIERYFEEVWNKGKLDVLDEIIDPGYINHNPGGAVVRPGPADLKPIVAHMRGAMPDLHYEILDMVITDDKVAVYTRVTGTQTGELWGLKPQGKKFEVRQMQIEWIRNGKIVQHWRVTDEMGWMKQLGHLQ